MLLLLREGEVLLEKRPPTGVWGGLWCLPEMPAGADPREYCRRRFGAKRVHATRLPLLRHGFTHFTLDVTPVVCRLEVAASFLAEPGQVWLVLEEAAQAAIPAPVRKLLLAVQKPGTDHGFQR
jgi:A/G-specific adenine glycosylase